MPCYRLVKVTWQLRCPPTKLYNNGCGTDDANASVLSRGVFVLTMPFFYPPKAPQPPEDFPDSPPAVSGLTPALFRTL